MSYDLDIWSVRPAELPGSLPDPDRWRRETDAWILSPADTWQIVVRPSDQVWPEDIPVDVMAALPGIAHVTRLHVEPASAPSAVRTQAVKAAKQLAQSGYGVVHDPQEQTLVTPSGVKRFAGAPREQVFSMLSLTWWFLDGPLLRADGVARLLDLLEAMLPEALPKRYGLYEPPQHLYEQQGRGHFQQFLSEHLADLVVWYPNRPVVGVALNARPGQGLERRGFRANTLSLEVEAAALELPGWETALRRVWKAASELVQPFFGDVRTLHNLLRSGATYSVNAKSDRHPVQGPWWKGIPRTLGHAVVLGPPYQSAWPSARECAEVSGELWFCSTPDWKSPARITEICGEPPVDLLQPHDAGAPPQQQGAASYARTWPLPGPFAEGR